MNGSLTTFFIRGAARDVLNVAFVSVWIWELITSLAEERVLLLEHRVTFPQIVYIVARVSSIICVTTASVLSAEDYINEKSWIVEKSFSDFQPYYASHCSDEMEFLGWIFLISTAKNSLLMFFRVRAVFSHSKPTVIAFGLLWAATLGGALTVPISIMTAIGRFHADTDSIYLGCEYIVFPTYACSAYLISAVYDALLFLAVTYRLLFHHLYRDGQTSRLKSFFSGEGLGHVSKVLLQTGQSYYLLTVGMNILNMISIFTPLLLPGAGNTAFMVPCVAMTNIMASMVYRQLKLGILPKDPWDQSKPPSAYMMTSRHLTR